MATPHPAPMRREHVRAARPDEPLPPRAANEHRHAADKSDPRAADRRRDVIAELFVELL